MKILLVKPILEKQRVWHYTPPLGLGYLATAVRNDYDVQILDCINERMDIIEFKSSVEKIKPDVVGFMFYSSEEFVIRESLKVVKEINSNIITVLGGPHPSVMPEETLREIPDTDYIFISEAEIGLPRFLKAVSSSENNKDKIFEDIPGLGWRKGSEIILNPSKVEHNLDALGIPSWDFLGLGRYKRRAPHGVFQKSYPSAPMMATRGCPYTCSYCSAGIISGKKIRKRSPEHIVEEITYLHEKYGIREISFLDDNFTFYNDYAKEICERIIKLNLGMTFNLPNGVRIDSLDEELLLLMKKAGWYSLTLGVESGTQRILNSIRKKLNLNIVKEKLELIHKVGGFTTIGFFMMGFPTEKREEIQNTIDLMFKGKFTFVTFNNFVPLPGTPIYYELKEKNELPEMTWNDTFIGEKVIYSPEGISPDELQNLRWKTLLRFYSKPRTIFNILIRIRFKNLRAIYTRFLAVILKR